MAARHVLTLAAALLVPLGALKAGWIAGLFAVLALAAAVLSWRRAVAALGGFPGRVFLVVVLWALATAPFAVDPAGAFALAGILIVTFLGVVLLLELPAETGPGFARALIAGYAVGAVLIALDVFTGNWLFHTLRGNYDPALVRWSAHNRAVDVMMLSTFVVMALLWRQGRRLGAFAAGLAMIAILVPAQSSSAKLAFLLAAIAAAATWRFGAMACRALAALSALAVLVMPLALWLPVERIQALVPEAKISALHRFHIWRFAGERIAEHPWLGWGLDAARAIPGGAETSPVGGQMMALHPHNAGLQIWLELGLVGALCGAWLMTALWRRIGAMPDALARATAAATAAAAFAIAMLSFGLWQGWWLATLGLVAVLTRAALHARF
ncbi:MAG: hypothetical protein FJX46_10255 [Alphaproteobacteria bacterium]|nr:hypothetical protein [Alphaproteobacteria bacterium]